MNEAVETQCGVSAPPPPPPEDEMIFTNNTPKMGIKLVYSMLGSNSTIYIQTLTEIIFTHKL